LDVLARKTNTRIIAISQLSHKISRPQKEDCPKYLQTYGQLRLFYRPNYEKTLLKNRKTETIEIISWNEHDEEKTDIVYIDKETTALRGVSD
jgi:hypothetical protein